MSNFIPSDNPPVFRVKTWGTCMEPLIGHEEYLLVKRCAFEDIRIGDVAYCRLDETFKFAHRVIEIKSDNGKRFVVTKPDQRDMIDPPIPEENILGKVIGKYVGDRLVFSDFRLQNISDNQNESQKK